MSENGNTRDEEEVSENFLGQLPVILWQRRWLVIVPVIVCTIAGLAAAIFLPAKYTSTAVLLVESQELPDAIVGSPLNTVIDQRIAKIRQQILSRPDLVELIQNNNLYAEERRTKPLSEIVETMRDSTRIAPVNADIERNRSGSSTIAFSLAFDYPDAARAQVVAQEFVERFLKLDSSQTAAAAASTVSFLEEQSASLQEKLRTVEGKIESIKAQNGMALSSAGMMPMSSGGSYETQIAQLQRENAQLAAEANNARSVERDPGVAAAEGALATARGIYSDNHPDVKFAEQRVAEARAAAAQRSSRSGASAAAQQQIAANNNSIGQLQAARGAEMARSNAVLSAQSVAPLVLERVNQLQAEADGLRANYEKVAGNLMAAQASAKMGNEQRGERLSVIDPPVVPDKPASPNRPLLIAGGILVGGAIGFALAMLVELILRPIRGVGALQNLLGVGPLVVVPTMSDDEPKWRKWVFWKRRKSPKPA